MPFRSHPDPDPDPDPDQDQGHATDGADIGLEGAFEREYLPSMEDALVVAVTENEREKRITAILVYDFEFEDTKEKLKITVPQSYITDFASIPAIARWLIPSFGRHAKAAVIHDWLYSIGEPGRKARADRVFLHALEELQVNPLTRLILYLAVHFGGAGGYNRAHAWWEESFGDYKTGNFSLPPFDRSTGFEGNQNAPVKF